MSKCETEIKLSLGPELKKSFEEIVALVSPLERRIQILEADLELRHGHISRPEYDDIIREIAEEGDHGRGV